jgi:hypothetical protein
MHSGKTRNTYFIVWPWFELNIFRTLNEDKWWSLRTFTILIYCRVNFFSPSCQDIINTCTNFFYSFIDRQGGLVFSACRVREIAYGLYDPSEEKCHSFFYCKIPILCQSLAKICQILLVMSDRTDEFDELCNSVLVKSTKNEIKHTTFP